MKQDEQLDLLEKGMYNYKYLNIYNENEEYENIFTGFIKMLKRIYNTKF